MDSAVASNKYNEFYLRGWTTVPNALSNYDVEGIKAEIAAQLAGQGALLHDASSWPRGGARRVLECAPIGSSAHWRALQNSQALVTALDELIGAGSWEMPLNVANLDGSLGVRHWYCPVAFPESAPSASNGDTSGRCGAVDVGKTTRASNNCAVYSSPAPGCPGPRRAELLSCAEEVALRGPLSNPSARWQPVNRRRFLSKGWHIDVGPGFPSKAVRTIAGDTRQGIVMLLLLSDCGVGAGGTALVPFSHLWVLEQLASAGNDGITHEVLNLDVVRRMRKLTEAGSVVLPCSDCCVAMAAAGDGDAVPSCLASTSGCTLPCANSWCHGDGLVHATAITGRAGDVVLVHPLLIHSGTTNLSSAPRILGNGMACAVHVSSAGTIEEGDVNNSAFESVTRTTHACPIMRATVRIRAEQRAVHCAVCRPAVESDR